MADDPTTPDNALALDIKETLTGRAGPEVSAVTLGNVPPGAVLSAGADKTVQIDAVSVVFVHVAEGGRNRILPHLVGLNGQVTTRSVRKEQGQTSA